MIHKKNTQHNISKKSPLFFGLGLCITLIMIITAFEWKFYEDRSFVDFGPATQAYDEILDIPLTKQQPPPPPGKSAVSVVEVVPEEEIPDDLEIDLDIEITEYGIPEPIHVGKPMEEEEVDQIITLAEEMPSPVGGYPAFYKFLGENIKYPVIAKKAGVEGRVNMEITISKDGKLENALVVKGIGFGCDEEALRVIRLWENWNPGRQRGVPRTIRMYIPLVFRFTD